MDDMQLNISIPKKDKKVTGVISSKSADFKFISKAGFSGKTLARKRPSKFGDKISLCYKNPQEPQQKVVKLDSGAPSKTDDVDLNLRDLSENKGKFKGKNYQELSDDILIKQKPRTGGWISSLFKNNPEVPRLGQRAVKPLVEKVFAGKNFSDLDIHPHSVANLAQNLHLKELMTVQQKAIPVILQGRDILIRSQTGSGKTLAYALPLIEGLQAIRPKINRHDGILVVVVVPTRELAVQTYELFVKLVKPFTWIVPGLLSGGQKRKAEKARLRKGLSILVGTPGRINDHLRHTKSLNFSKTNCLVLDEADRLLDMGYEKDVAAIVKSIEEHKINATYDPMALIKQSVKKVISDDETEKSAESPSKDTCEPKAEIKHHLTEVFMSKERQTILLSATLSKAVENLAGLTMVDPVFVDTSEGRAVVADSIKQKQEVYVKVNHKEVESEPQKPESIKEEAKLEEVQVESKRGLKQFSGKNHLDLFDMKTVKESESRKAKDDSDSDSDSDYEYFKVQKKLESRNIKGEPEVDDSTEAVVDNIFTEAVKSAVMEDELILPASVNQTFLITPMKLRLVTLCSLIVEHCVMNKKSGKMIVFMATLEMVDYHADLIETVLTGEDVKVKKKINKLKKRKHSGDSDKEESPDSDSEFEVDYQAPPEGGVMPVDIEMFKLHGSMPHEQRMEVFKQFRNAKTGVLICTDVAARGIDVPRVDLVLQYCAPASATDYVHRVGRTGRATQVGAAVLMLLPSEAEFVRYLEQKRIRLRQADESRALSPLQHVVPSAANANRAAVAVQARLEHTAHSTKEWLARASRAYTSWIGFYSAYPREVREFLDPRQLHLGHSAKAFALRETPGALARRAKNDPNAKKERPTNRLTVHEDEEKRRQGFPRVKVGSLAKKVVNKQSSMHTASEFDSGLPPLQPHNKKKKKLK